MNRKKEEVQKEKQCKTKEGEEWGREGARKEGKKEGGKRKDRGEEGGGRETHTVGWSSKHNHSFLAPGCSLGFPELS